MYLSERNANDGDAKNKAIEDMGEPNPDTTHEEPQHRYNQNDKLDAVIGLFHHFYVYTFVGLS